VVEANKVLFDEDPAARFYIMMDDTEHVWESHSISFTVWGSARELLYRKGYHPRGAHRRQGAPQIVFWQMSASADKTADSNAVENILAARRFSGENLERLAVGVGDHAADAELKEMHVQAQAACSASVEALVHAQLGDDMHKTPLYWATLSNTVFGEDKAVIRDPHHCQILYSLRFVYEKDPEEFVAAAKEFMGGEGPWSTAMAKIINTRWLYTEKASDKVTCMSHRSLTPLTPDTHTLPLPTQPSSTWR